MTASPVQFRRIYSEHTTSDPEVAIDNALRHARAEGYATHVEAIWPDRQPEPIATVWPDGQVDLTWLGSRFA